MCHESYGFLPCATNVPGNLFLVLTYGFLVYKGGYLPVRGASCCTRSWDLVSSAASSSPYSGRFQKR
jgi:hypothetical protein